MLTPQQIKDYEFKASGRNAYKADDVDKFFAELTIDYEKMFRENAELIKRVSLLADKLEQYKNDEDNIKNAVMTANKAADLIVKDAENSVADSRAEAEAVLNAAKSEADLIKSDAEKQAVADSELLLSMTRDKAQEIIRKAKDEAAAIVLEAKSSASDKMGAATRTITSETLHFDMLKKEVAEFKANILSQYKAHIELLSKLPELAEKKAEEIDSLNDERDDSEDETVEYIAPVQDGEEVSIQVDEITLEDNAVEEAEENVVAPAENTAVETEAFDDIAKESLAFDEEENDDENVVKTTLPYDFFDNKDSTLEFVDSAEIQEDIAEIKGETTEDVKESDFSLDVDFNFNFDDLSEDSFHEEKKDKTEETIDTTDTEENFEAPVNGFKDIPISKGFSIDKNVIEKLDEEEIAEEDNNKKHHGFFKRKK